MPISPWGNTSKIGVTGRCHSNGGLHQEKVFITLVGPLVQRSLENASVTIELVQKQH